MHVFIAKMTFKQIKLGYRNPAIRRHVSVINSVQTGEFQSFGPKLVVNE